jgi:hypothetical protein
VLPMWYFLFYAFLNWKTYTTNLSLHRPDSLYSRYIFMVLFFPSVPWRPTQSLRAYIPLAFLCILLSNFFKLF